MKYEENTWYGWNGGECPVHPETVVECAFIADPTQRKCTTKAKDIFWGEKPTVGIEWYSPTDNLLKSTPVGPVAFRVIKEHKEPREFLIMAGVVYIREPKPIFGEEIIHVREVIEE